jgi:biopolymer transport protein ExbD
VSVRFECPVCGAAHQVHKQALGHRLRCPKCNELVEVVEAVEPPPSPTHSLEMLAAERAQEPLPMDLIDDSPIESPAQELAVLEPVIAPVVWGQPAAADGPAPHVAAPSRATSQAVQKRPRVQLRHKSPLREAEMDMTPMVDVTFLLLIFFMVTASFTMQKSLNIPKPQQDETSTQSRSIQDFQDNPEYVVVRIDAVNTYHVSTAAWPDEVEAPSEQELLVKLRQARLGDSQGNIPSKLLVIANGEALHERVVTAIDSGNDVGMEEVQLLTVEDDDS